MANSFFKNGDKAYSENLNDGILVGNAFDWTVSIGLPADNGGVFPNSSTIVKAKMADVSITPNSNLSIGSSIENSSGSSQVYRLTVYPNFNRFGGFKSISLTADSGVTFYIANKGGTSPIASNMDYDDLSNVPELKVLKEYDIVITIPMNKEVTGLEFVFQSSSADVSGSISQSNVTGLNNTITAIQSKDTQQDNRLNSIEGINSTIYNYEIISSEYNVQIDSNIIISCHCTDIEGVNVIGKVLTLKRNGTTVGTSTTNQQGVATWTVTCDEWGLQDFRVENTSIQVNVTGWREITIGTGRLWVNDETKTAVYYFTRTGAITTEISYANVIPSSYRPYNYIRMIAHNSTGAVIKLGVESSGTVRLTSSSYSSTSVTVACQITYGYGMQ